MQLELLGGILQIELIEDRLLPIVCQLWPVSCTECFALGSEAPQVGVGRYLLGSQFAAFFPNVFSLQIITINHPGQHIFHLLDIIDNGVYARFLLRIADILAAQSLQKPCRMGFGEPVRAYCPFVVVDRDNVDADSLCKCECPIIGGHARNDVTALQLPMGSDV